MVGDGRRLTERGDRGTNHSPAITCLTAGISVMTAGDSSLVNLC